MSNQSNCPHSHIELEVFGTGLVPAEFIKGGWELADRPAPYVDWEYGQAFCADCGANVTGYGAEHE